MNKILKKNENKNKLRPTLRTDLSAESKAMKSNPFPVWEAWIKKLCPAAQAELGQVTPFPGRGGGEESLALGFLFLLLMQCRNSPI